MIREANRDSQQILLTSCDPWRRLAPLDCVREALEHFKIMPYSSRNRIFIFIFIIFIKNALSLTLQNLFVFGIQGRTFNLAIAKILSDKMKDLDSYGFYPGHLNL